MGITPPFTEALIREGMYSPIVGDVLLIGRQTVYHTPQDILDLFRKLGADTGGVSAEDLELDRNTKHRMSGHTDKILIADSALFRLLGTHHVMALDHSDYEGAEIVGNLNFPLDTTVRADFIFDGSTLDNIFNPAQGIKNFADLLRPGGRVISVNTYTNRNFPYTMVSPLWLFDYFVINGFADCRVYIVVETPKTTNVFTINLDDLMDEGRSVSAFVSPYEMSTLVFAEKGPQSTSDRLPSQQHYRSAAEWALYRKNLAVIRASSRPHLLRSAGDIEFFDVPGGHLFIADDFTPQDPMTQINRLKARSAFGWRDRTRAAVSSLKMAASTVWK